MAETTLRIMCPNLTCRRILAVPSSARGKTVRCRGCQTNIRIPTKEDTAGAMAPPGDKPPAEGAKPQPAKA